MKARPNKAFSELKAYFGTDPAIQQTNAFLKKIRVHVRQHHIKNPDVTVPIFDPAVKALFNGKEHLKLRDIADMVKARLK